MQRRRRCTTGLWHSQSQRPCQLSVERQLSMRWQLPVLRALTTCQLAGRVPVTRHPSRAETPPLLLPLLLLFMLLLLLRLWMLLLLLWMLLLRQLLLLMKRQEQVEEHCRHHQQQQCRIQYQQPQQW